MDPCEATVTWRRQIHTKAKSPSVRSQVSLASYAFDYPHLTLPFCSHTLPSLLSSHPNEAHCPALAQIHRDHRRNFFTVINPILFALFLLHLNGFLLLSEVIVVYILLSFLSLVAALGIHVTQHPKPCNLGNTCHCLHYHFLRSFTPYLFTLTLFLPSFPLLLYTCNILTSLSFPATFPILACSSPS